MRPHFNYPWRARPWRRPHDCWIRLADPSAVVYASASSASYAHNDASHQGDLSRRRSASLTASSAWAAVTPRSHGSSSTSSFAASAASGKRKADDAALAPLQRALTAKPQRLGAAEHAFLCARAAAAAQVPCVVILGGGGGECVVCLSYSRRVFPPFIPDMSECM